MAIVVPFKHIYSTKSKKIKNNVIDKITVLPTEISVAEEFDKPVHKELVENIQDRLVADGQYYSFGYDGDGEGIRYEGRKDSLASGLFHYVAVRLKHSMSFCKLVLDIPKEKPPKEKITSVFSGENQDEEGKDKISVSLYGTIKETPLKERVVGVSGGEATFEGEEIDPDKNGSESDVQSLNIEDPKDVSSSATLSSAMSVSVSSDIVLQVPYSTSEEIMLNGRGYFRVTIYIPQRTEIVSLSGSGTKTETTNILSFEIYGTKTVKEIHSAEITIDGNRKVIQLDESTVTIGNGENELSVQGNELLQPMIAKNYAYTLDAYKNGRESITIECDLGEYYNEDGTKAISTNGEKDENGKELPMSFKNGDVLLITKSNEKGEEVPIARKSNGEPMLFYVVGTELTYDGEILQKIFAQEY